MHHDSEAPVTISRLAKSSATLVTLSVLLESSSQDFFARFDWILRKASGRVAGADRKLSEALA